MTKDAIIKISEGAGIMAHLNGMDRRPTLDKTMDEVYSEFKDIVPAKDLYYAWLVGWDMMRETLWEVKRKANG